MNPEYLKDIFTKHSDFHKPKSSQLVKLLANGLVNHEDEKWAKHRKIINPAFHMEKLKVLIYSLRTLKSVKIIGINISHEYDAKRLTRLEVQCHCKYYISIYAA